MKRKVFGLGAGVLLCLLLYRVPVQAGNTDIFEEMNAGAGEILDSMDTGEDLVKITREELETAPTSLVMANVKYSLNIREEASEDSGKAGLLYADCGGRILEKKDGWTKIESGSLVGWANDEYLLFGAEAETLAKDVGRTIATIHADALRVRKEPEEEAGVWGVVKEGEALTVAYEENPDGWVSVEYGDEVGYVSAEFVTVELDVDEGETMESIRLREKKEAEEKARIAAEKAKLTQNRGAVAVDAPDEVLLAALIQCESGNQPYEGQLAVGAVVMNRVRSGAYPSSVNGVIYASGQFGPAMTGKVDALLANGRIKDSCLQAAREAIAGNSNVGSATHFRRAGSREGIVIGAHVFW